MLLLGNQYMGCAWTLIGIMGYMAMTGTDNQSFILHAAAPSYHWSGVGLLSIKSFYGGQAMYEIGGGRAAVSDDHYFVVNHGQHYAITIDSASDVESCCVFFAPGIAEDVQRSLVTPVARLLDDPTKPLAPVLFFEKTYTRDELVSPILQMFRALDTPYCDEGWLTEQLHGLMQRLLQVHYNVYRETEALPAARPATREELYRRVHRARDYAAASFDQSLTLNELARVACLSPNHLLRTFRQAFGQTPHQYLTNLRLRRAQMLLIKTDLSVTDICFSVGFQSIGSFSWLFKQQFGVSPNRYRRQSR
jgi:AraC-like DNA-binding protein